jgi:uncharacterized membrane protein
MALVKPHVGRIFVTGLLTLIPAVATIYLIVWTFGALDRLFGKPLRVLMPEDYLAGMGILLAVAVVFGVGALMHAVLFRRIFRKTEEALLAVPLARSVYSALKDLIGLFGRNNGPAMQVVAVTLPGTDWKLLGFISRAEFTDLPSGIGSPGEVAVYLPMSYQVGGYTVIVPRDAVKPLDMSREDAMKFILTAGLKTVAAPRTHRAAAPGPARTRPS